MHTRGKHYTRNLAKRNAAKRRELLNAISDYKYGEFDGEAVNDLSEIPEGYRGLVLHVNDHGNITLLKSFKNGNTHEVWGMV